MQFAYSNESTSCGTGGGLPPTGTGQCSDAPPNTNGGTPPCDCYVGSELGFVAPNWGGHGAGCWMSGNGAAATTTTAVNNDGAVHVLFGCGNGGFQELTGSTRNKNNNNGNTVMDFTLPASGAPDSDQTGAFQTFTTNLPASNNGSSPNLGPGLPSDCGCGTPAGCAACTSTVQTLNAYDWDQSTGGITLFNDLSGTLRAVTVDKSGVGYLLTPGQLCGPGSVDTACVGFAMGDPGSWTFGASEMLCMYMTGGAGAKCDRVTSMAVYDNQGTGDCGSGGGHCVYLNYWANNERLTALRLSDATAQMGVGTLEPEPSVSPYALHLHGAAGTCQLDVNCLTEQVVAGDTLVLNAAGCVCSTQSCPVITSVTTTSSQGVEQDSYVTVNAPVAVAYTSNCINFPSAFTYSGYFVKPAHDMTPYLTAAGYPGGAVTISANCASPAPCTDGLVWALWPSNTSQDGSLDRGLGELYAYKALPNGDDVLLKKWGSTDVWCASSFARPTIVNGSAFAPTYAANCPSGAVCMNTKTFQTCQGPTSMIPMSIGMGGPYPSGVTGYALPPH